MGAGRGGSPVGGEVMIELCREAGSSGFVKFKGLRSLSSRPLPELGPLTGSPLHC
jgi:hypothetical protein